ncbi:MAG: ATP-binding protein [bacterium]
MSLKGSSGDKQIQALGQLPFDREHYREIKRRHIARMFVTYLAPLILLVIYFQYRYNNLIAETSRLHLGAIAENQANTLDLFLSERGSNLTNLIDHPKFKIPPSPESMEEYLRDLKKASEVFVDIGFFDPTGVQVSYVGPYPSLEQKNYSSEQWYLSLKNSKDNFIITDIYLGFRQRPHFTIAVSRTIGEKFYVLRATLDPERMYDYITSQQWGSDFITSIINTDGYYQLVTDAIGQPLDLCPFNPPGEEKFGTSTVDVQDRKINFAYYRLKTASWSIIVQSSKGDSNHIFGFQPTVLLVSVVLILLVILVTINRAGVLVRQQMESDLTRVQLEHASKLASVGELAAGIAHEINNPLAVISEEAGLILDYKNPEFDNMISEEDLLIRLNTIQQSAFRCRDITRKLLNFVRKSDLVLGEHNINDIIDGVVVGLLGPEIKVSNLELICNYAENLPALVTDKNQLQQVLLNIINNARDAIGDNPGKITISTFYKNSFINIEISDTGYGMTSDQLGKIFLPFYTTKEVGKGTGLGLSVSFGIIRNLGGRIDVVSTPGKGSTFTIILPIKRK